MMSKLERARSHTQQNIEKTINHTIGAPSTTNHIRHRTDYSQRFLGEGEWGLNPFYWYQILDLI